jgi:hypothetical protein
MIGRPAGLFAWSAPVGFLRRVGPERVAYRRVLGAKTLTGDTAWSFDGDYLGKIKEIMIDLQSGPVAYVVLSIGGLLGIGE